MFPKVRLLCLAIASALIAFQSISPGLDPEAVKSEIEALAEGDVAWREIGWGTCLLEGLKVSRAQGKPVVLWVFIDRPVDDKRC